MPRSRKNRRDIISNIPFFLRQNSEAASKMVATLLPKANIEANSNANISAAQNTWVNACAIFRLSNRAVTGGGNSVNWRNHGLCTGITPKFSPP